MRKILIIILLIIGNSFINAATKVDSLYSAAQKEISIAMEYIWQLQDSKLAIPRLERAYAYLDSIDSNADSILYSEIFCLDRLADAYVVYSMYTNAEQSFTNLINIYNVQVKDTFNYSYLGLLYKKANVLREIGQFSSSVEYYNRAKILYNKLEKSPYRINTTYFFDIAYELAKVYLELGDLDKALMYLNEIMEHKDFNDTESYIQRNVYVLLGDIYYNLCLRDIAEKLYLAAYDKNLSYQPEILERLGNISCQRGDWKQAEEYLFKINPLPNDGYNASTLLFNIGMGFYQAGELDKARNYLSQYIIHLRCIISQNLSIKSEKGRNIYWNAYERTHIEPLIYFWYHDRTASSGSNLYDILLFTKGLLLFQHQTIQNTLLNSPDSLLVTRWNQLLGTQENIYKAQVLNNDTMLACLKIQESYLEREILDNVWVEVTRTSGIIEQTTWDSVRNNLADNQVAIEYMVAPLNEDSTMYCALLLRDTCSYPVMIPLFNEPKATSLINTTTENQTSFTYSYDGNGKQLTQLVWNKILPYIKKGETVYFAPSGLLHQLAIESLPYDEDHTMADMFNLVRLSSTREIVTHRQDTQHTSAALYGGIQYDVDTDELLAESEKYSAADLLASRGLEGGTLDRGSIKYLKGTKSEVENINSMLKQNNLQVQLFTSTNANEESFKALSGKHQNILHIATHGFFWTDSTAQKKEYFSQRMLTLDNNMPSPPAIDPLNRCGLLFAGAQTAWSGHSSELPEGVQDGILTAKEISLLDLRDADLVVLSACETGKGEITGDGVFGLQRAFKQAGAQTIIMSLWPVNDAATQLLMIEFYRNWITNHQSKREAFKNAQNTIRSQYEEPVYWAGFIMLD